MKRCKKCGIEKAAEDFYKNPTCAGGRANRCIACVKEREIENRVHRNATRRAWKRVNRDKVRPGARRYYLKNREKLDAVNSAWWIANPEKKKDKSKRSTLKRDKIKHLASSLKWQSENKEKANARNSRRRARVNGSIGTHTADDTKMLRSLQNDCFGHCRLILNGSGHLDHIMPLSMGGSNWPNNLQWLCSACNLKKNNKDPRAFVRETGLMFMAWAA